MASREGAPPQELSGLQFYNQRRSQKGRKPLSSSFLSRCHASIVSSSSMSGGGGFFCPYMVKTLWLLLWLLWHYGKIISDLSTLRILHFEMLPFHKLLFFYVCRGGCFRAGLTAMLGLQSFPGLFLPLIFLLIFSTVIYGLSQLQQFFKDWFGPSACFCNLWQISGADWEVF